MSAQDPHRNTLTGPVVSHDFSPPSRGGRRSQALALLTIAVALLCVTALQTDSGTLSGALKQWQAQIARGLHVSLRAVADGRDQPASAPPPATVATRELNPR